MGGTSLVDYSFVAAFCNEHAEMKSMEPGSLPAFGTSVLHDLALRWTRARCAALRSVLPARSAEGDEHQLLARVIASCADSAAVERRVFELSLALGRSFSHFYGAELELTDLQGTLPLLGIGCSSGMYCEETTESALRIVRLGCPVEQLGPRGCSFYREALSGLLLGVTGKLLLSRHASRGHGDFVCVDLIHENAESRFRFGPVPAFMNEGLLEVIKSVRFFDSSVALEFLGMSEGTLHYRCRQGAESRLHLTSLVERGVRRRFPGVELREVSAHAVTPMDRS